MARSLTRSESRDPNRTGNLAIGFLHRFADFVVVRDDIEKDLTLW
jgi:hypothetical protein